MNPHEFSILIPVYNEEKGIHAVLSDLFNEPALKDAEIIVIDDGSTDSTSQEVRRFSEVHLVRHPLNRGYGAAISTGIKVSKRKYVLWFDGDGQHRAEDLLKVMEALVSGDFDYCIGVRDALSYQDSSRKFGKFILKLAIRLISGKPIQDFNSGLRGFKREVIMRYMHLLPRRFGASTVSTLLMIEQGYIGEEVPITVRQRIGKSSVKQISDGLGTLMLLLRFFLLFKPIHFFGGIGTALILIGTAYGLMKAAMVHHGFPVLAALVVLLGVQTLFFGLICDQISSLRQEKLK